MNAAVQVHNPIGKMIRCAENPDNDDHVKMSIKIHLLLNLKPQ